MGRLEEVEPEEVDFYLENAEIGQEIHDFLKAEAETYSSDLDETDQPDSTVSTREPVLKVSPNELLEIEFRGNEEISEYLEELYENGVKERYELFN